MLNRPRLAIGLVSAMLVALEIAWTRIFSAEFFYSFAFLIVSLAVLGLGLGALCLRLWPPLGQSPALGILALVASAAAAVGPPVVLRLDIEFVEVWRQWQNIPLVLLGVMLLMVPFLGGGALIAALLKNGQRDIPGLYMADLMGAAAGGLVAVWLMNTLGVPAAAFLCCVFGAWSGWGGGAVQRGAALVLVLVLVGAGYAAGDRLVPPGKEPAPVIAQHWDALGKLKVYVHGANARSINIDNAANMVLLRGYADRPSSLPEGLDFQIDFRPLIQDLKLYRVMVVGAGGGSDVLQARQAGAREIHAVEVNAALNRMLLEGEQAEFTGYLYRDPAVEVVAEDARPYARRRRAHFDLIVSRSANTFAALSSGAFALAENYLFTREAFVDFYRALSADGVLLVEHQVYIPRLVGAAMEALGAMGLENPAQHVLVYDLPTLHRQVLVLSRRPGAQAWLAQTLGELLARADARSQLLHPVDVPQHLISRIAADGWQAHWREADIDISPPTDNRPFVAQMGRWDRLQARHAAQALAFEFTGFPLAKLMMASVLVLVAVVGVPLLFLPFRAAGARLRGAGWLYFVAIGIGFMVVEVVWIQQYSLFLGHSAYTFVIVLLALLLSAGTGSYYCERFGEYLPFVGVVFCILAQVLAFPALVAGLGALDFVWRAALSFLAIGPAGFFMGMLFPRAAVLVGGGVDWGFAVNGVASVFGATLAVFMAIHVGFAATLLVGALCYVGAMVLWGRRQAFSAAPGG